MRIACCVFSAMFLLSPGTLVARSEVTNSKQPTDQLYVFVRFSADGDGSTLGWHGLLAIDPKTGVWKKLVERGFDAQVSPNGQVLAVNGVDDFGIWTCTSKSGEGLRKITEVRNPFNIVCWSPDGGEVIVRFKVKRKESSVTEFWRVKADGSNKVKIELPDGYALLDWSRDGNWLLTFRRTRETGGQLYVMRPDGGERRQLTTEGDNTPARFSPDGKRIAYLHRVDTRAGRPVNVWMVDFDGKNHRQIFAPEGAKAYRLCWAPDGKRLALALLDLREDTMQLKELNMRPVIIDLEGKVIRSIKLPACDMLLVDDWR